MIDEAFTASQRVVQGTKEKLERLLVPKWRREVKRHTFSQSQLSMMRRDAGEVEEENRNEGG